MLHEHYIIDPSHAFFVCRLVDELNSSLALIPSYGPNVSVPSRFVEYCWQSINRWDRTSVHYGYFISPSGKFPEKKTQQMLRDQESLLFSILFRTINVPIPLFILLLIHQLTMIQQQKPLFFICSTLTITRTLCKNWLYITRVSVTLVLTMINAFKICEKSGKTSFPSSCC